MDNFILVSGNDELAVKSKARSLIVEICGEDFENNQSLEIVSGDSDKQKVHNIISDFITTILTPPFLSADKIVWLRNFPFESLFKSKTEAIEEAVEKLKETLNEAIPSYLTIVLSGVGMDRRSSLYKNIQKLAVVHFFERIDSSSKGWHENVRGLIYDYCEQNAVRISGDAITFLSETIGTDGGRIRSELDKIIAFIYPAKEIAYQDCEAICSRTPEASAWAFSNSISARDLKSALSAIDITMSTTKNAEIAMLYSLMNNFKSMMAIKSAAKMLKIRPGTNYNSVKTAIENPPADVKLELGDNPIFAMHPYKASILLNDSAKFADAELSAIISEILKTNRAMVSESVLSKRALLEQLTIKICSRSK